MIKFRCSHCNQKIGTEDEHAGRKLRCPGCKNVERVPDRRKERGSESRPGTADKRREGSAHTAIENSHQREDGTPSGSKPQSDFRGGDFSNFSHLLEALETEAPTDAELPTEHNSGKSAPPSSAVSGGAFQCPSCHAGVSPNAALCIQCGFNILEGRRTRTKVKRAGKGRAIGSFGFEHISASGLLLATTSVVFLSISVRSEEPRPFPLLPIALSTLALAVLMIGSKLRRPDESTHLLTRVQVIAAAVILPLGLLFPLIPTTSKAVIGVIGLLGIGIILGGFLLGLVGAIWSLFLTLREGLIQLLANLFVPFYGLYYLITRWHEQRDPFHAYLSGGLMIMIGAAPLISIATSQASRDDASVSSAQSHVRSDAAQPSALVNSPGARGVSQPGVPEDVTRNPTQSDQGEGATPQTSHSSEAVLSERVFEADGYALRLPKGWSTRPSSRTLIDFERSGPFGQIKMNLLSRSRDALQGDYPEPKMPDSGRVKYKVLQRQRMNVNGTPVQRVLVNPINARARLQLSRWEYYTFVTDRASGKFGQVQMHYWTRTSDQTRRHLRQAIQTLQLRKQRRYAELPGDSSSVPQWASPAASEAKTLLLMGATVRIPRGLSGGMHDGHFVTAAESETFESEGSKIYIRFEHLRTREDWQSAKIYGSGPDTFDPENIPKRGPWPTVQISGPDPHPLMPGLDARFDRRLSYGLIGDQPFARIRSSNNRKVSYYTHMDHGRYEFHYEVSHKPKQAKRDRKRFESLIRSFQPVSDDSSSTDGPTLSQARLEFDGFAMSMPPDHYVRNFDTSPYYKREITASEIGDRPGGGSLTWTVVEAANHEVNFELDTQRKEFKVQVHHDGAYGGYEDYGQIVIDGMRLHRFERGDRIDYYMKSDGKAMLIEVKPRSAKDIPIYEAMVRSLRRLE